MISSEPWGEVGGAPVELFTLSSGAGMTVRVSTFGGAVQAIEVPDRTGRTVNVALGFSSLEEYADNVAGAEVAYFGAIMGRYANRIAGGPFSLDGRPCALADGEEVLLHGGPSGYHRQVWGAAAARDSRGDVLRLEHVDLAGHGGFPGTVRVTVEYAVSAENALRIAYRARSDAPTVVNLTNHTYFNLAGEGSGEVHDQQLAIDAGVFQPVDEAQIPVRFAKVDGTPFDFRAMKPIGRDLGAREMPMSEQLEIGRGYDQSLVLNGAGYRLAAVACSLQTGISLWTYTDQPGLQLYSGNHLARELIGTSGRAYGPGAGFALETQRFPDAPHHIGEPGWPEVVLRPGQVLQTSTTYRFGLAGPELAERIRF